MNFLVHSFSQNVGDFRNQKATTTKKKLEFVSYASIRKGHSSGKEGIFTPQETLKTGFVKAEDKSLHCPYSVGLSFFSSLLFFFKISYTGSSYCMRLCNI